MPKFPSMSGAKLLRIIRKLGYVVERQHGSHRTMVCDGRPALLFSFHDSDSVPPGLVRKVLIKDVGLSEEEALACL